MKQTSAQILVVDDNLDTLNILNRKLSSHGFTVTTVNDVSSALAVLETSQVDIVLTDYKMPKITGLELIRHLRAHYSQIPVIMLTGYPSIEGAVEAVKVGAEQYLSKPFTDNELFTAIEQALTKCKHKINNNKLRLSNPYGIIGVSPQMQDLFSMIQKCTTNNATVLIHGESGTGKELVARAIHYHSHKNKAPFVPVNCGAIPESLLEAELFGYMKGSFTGATETRAGYFITADGGSIFLDEISETSLSMQVRLLRVLQDKQVHMIGSKTPRQINIRIIAATNKDLPLLVKQGGFREDLYFRLNVLPIYIPPLREHPEDIIPLVRHFSEKYASENTTKTPEFSEAAIQSLLSYAWPGNVRELENLVYRMVILIEGRDIDVQDLPNYMKFTLHHQQNLQRPLRVIEAEYIRNVLASVEGNKSIAAKILGIDRKTLYNKLNELDDHEKTLEELP
ncbi:MAG: sigma-54 dependent transcriptional regulator [Candidatus Cloacimonetes bacterium]|nr:sigma-54 dependent transcriptional regulator [Candidatus Cloacimonadota bacterium]